MTRRVVPGAHTTEHGTTFVAWSTRAKKIDVRLFDADRRPIRTQPLDPIEGGVFEAHLEGVGAGALYMFVVDGNEVPDPYARFLPFGPHGPARVEPRRAVAALPDAPPLERSIFYELHVGTFTEEGTYRAAERKLDALVDLGVTTIELLPLAAFPGERGWGYDGVALFAPYAPYGEPEDLASFVQAAHARGLAVFLDVVLNHFGPSGNYLWSYAEEYFTKEIETPWGAAPDFAHAPMRGLATELVRYWLGEWGFDGLRLDATHEIHDRSSPHVLREITELAHAMTPRRLVVFEDERNDPTMLVEHGADGVWADDLHHQVHVLLTGERDGYYRAHEPTSAALVKTIQRGWIYEGAPYAPWKGRPRGKPAPGSGIEPSQLVLCLQNHDQIGNRALGERLGQLTSAGDFLVASALLFFLPGTPLLFMGQEWNASTPFFFFADHEGDLGNAVREGRLQEFASFSAFSDPGAREQIPDPQAASTFERSKLRWSERDEPMHARALATTRALVALRKTDPVLSARSSWSEIAATTKDGLIEVVRRHGGETRRLLASFAEAPVPIALSAGARVLLTVGVLDGKNLGAKSAVIVDR